MVGTTGRVEGGNYIVALDAETGKEAWRFYTIARPGEQGGNSWNALPLDKRNGGSVWIPGSYDPVQQPGVLRAGQHLRHRAAARSGAARRRQQRCALSRFDARHQSRYRPAGLVLPAPGERPVGPRLGVRAPGDAAARQRRDARRGGHRRQADDLRHPRSARPDKYSSSIDLGLQNVVTSIDPKTGAKIVSQELVPGDGQTKMVCPHVSGGRGWLPTSYDAATKILYIPITEACMDLVPVPQGERGSLSTGVRWTVRPRPASDGKYGRMHAVNLETGKTVWVDRQRAPITAGTLATAGGLVFAGALDRMFRAHDATTGAMLWSARLNDAPSAPPIAYAANNQRVRRGDRRPGGYQSLSYSALVPEIQNPADRNAMLWVFEVPNARRRRVDKRRKIDGHARDRRRGDDCRSDDCRGEACRRASAADPRAAVRAESAHHDARPRRRSATTSTARPSSACRRGSNGRSAATTCTSPITWAPSSGSRMPIGSKGRGRSTSPASLPVDKTRRSTGRSPTRRRTSRTSTRMSRRRRSTSTRRVSGWSCGFTAGTPTASDGRQARRPRANGRGRTATANITQVAESSDGIHFDVRPAITRTSYLRVFPHGDVLLRDGTARPAASLDRRAGRSSKRAPNPFATAATRTACAMSPSPSAATV